MTKLYTRMLGSLILVLCAAPLLAQDYGWAVAIAEDEVFVAESGNEAKPGYVYVYRRSTDGGWGEYARLEAPDAVPGDHFGRALVVTDGTLMIGATVMDESRGAVYFFERDADGSWALATRIQPAGLSPGDAMGMIGSIDGDIAMVGSRGHNGGAGAVYVFRRDGSGDWSEAGMLTGSDSEPGDFFGYTMTVSGDLAVVGTPIPEGQSGAAYVFRHDAATDRWVEEARLGASDAEANHGFGQAVAVVEGFVLVGSPGRDRGTGGVYVFERAQSGAWGEVGLLLPFDSPRSGQFGSSIGMDGSNLWIGAPGADTQGRVYVLQRDEETGSFTGAAKLGASDVGRGAAFGNAFTVSGDLAVVSAPGADFGVGSVYIFERGEDGAFSAGTEVFSESVGLDPIVGEQVDCDEGSASVFGCDQVDILSFLPVGAIGGARGTSVNDVWGWTDPQTGREYALVGRTAGTAFIDITDPANPVYLGNLAMTSTANGSTWRDIKVYQDHAFIVSDGAGEHGMQVFDLARLRDVSAAPVEFDEDAHYDGIWSAHNIVINEATGFAYAVGVNMGGESCGGGLHMIDIREPQTPTFAGCFADAETGWQGTGYSHDAMCIIYDGPDTEYVGKEICFGSNENALSISDVSDKNNPVAVSNATYPSVAYAHQGWITEDHRYFFMNDEGDELSTELPGTRTLIFDVTDLEDPVLVTEHFGETLTSDHNLYIKGNLMYQSNYVSGLRILDISDPENPVEVGFFDTVPWREEPAMDGSWSNYPYFESGTIVVTSGREGVFFLKKREPELVP
jgi:choice-of-anchor B domain-containing protein